MADNKLKIKPQIAAILKTLPERPGVYLMRDAEGKIIYVGKAIKLKRRVSSYFRHNFANPRLRKLVSLIEDISIIRTETEAEALITEAKLIRRYSPFFNVDLKFNDRYPYVKITLSEDFPRLEVTRHKDKEESADIYLGPFTRAGDIRELMRVIARYFPLRVCKSNLKINNLKSRPCIEYNLGRSMGACAGLCTQAEYRERVNDIILLLQGKPAELAERLKLRMDEAAKVLDFETAAHYRDAIRAVWRVSRQQVSSALSQDLDNETWQVLNDLQSILNLKILPWRIDAFDISHTSGHDTYGVCIVFEQGRPNKSLYRKFKIKTLADGEINDFQAIYETVYRRYKHIIAKSEPTPQLTLIDGGLGQLDYALKALSDLNLNNLNVIALAEREELVYYDLKQEPLKLGRDNSVLQLLQRVRDEAHRFAITTHRAARNKRFKSKERKS
ncbi:MAG: excinuclease ABC subunit UvrC [Synergistaceae bacterium]|nr:excinuclease ABC subunit UvrC [Synergistaceae bacterium]MBR0221677.1 excinuclease ABC subunit UvrC [Synergistaceae bacterium]